MGNLDEAKHFAKSLKSNPDHVDLLSDDEIKFVDIVIQASKIQDVPI